MPDISYLQSHLDTIYGEINKKNAYNLDYFLGYMVRSVSSFTKILRNISMLRLRPYNKLQDYKIEKNNKVDDAKFIEEELKQKFIKTVAYTFSFAQSIDIEIQECLIIKFPEKCSYCLKRTCECIVTDMSSRILVKREEELEEAYKNLKSKILSEEIIFDLDYFVDKIIHKLYPYNLKDWNTAGGPKFHISKILEELGEIHEAYSKYLSVSTNDKDRENYKIFLMLELADFLAWVLSCWRLFDPENKITESFLEYYSNGCPSCENKKCNCEPRTFKDDMIPSKEIINSTLSAVINIKSDDLEIIERQNSIIEMGQKSLNSYPNINYKIFFEHATKLLREFDYSGDVLGIYKKVN